MSYDKSTAIEVLFSTIHLKRIQAKELIAQHTGNREEAVWNVERAESLHSQICDLERAIEILEKTDMPEKRSRIPLEASGGVTTRAGGLERFCNAVLSFCNGNPAALISGFAVLVLVMVIFAGCQSISGTNYPWNDPLTDEHGQVVPKPSWTNSVEVKK